MIKYPLMGFSRLKHFQNATSIPSGTHIFGRTGMCRPDGSLFLLEILKHGPTFLTEPEITWFSGKSRNLWIGYFWRKILKSGYPFWPKSPLKMGMGFEARAGHPCPTQIWVPPWASIKRKHKRKIDLSYKSIPMRSNVCYIWVCKNYVL